MQRANAVLVGSAGIPRAGDVMSNSPLLTLEELAELLVRTPAGLRATMYSNTAFGESLRSARVKLGRRVYFRRDLINRLIEEATGR